MKAPVNKVIPFSSVDGPGNRTAVFLQGCNFDCKYCHNPETRNMCCGCGECVKHCPTGALSADGGSIRYNPAVCCMCDTCIKTCPYGSSPRIRNMDAEEVFREVSRQIPYIRGITVSGGECMLRPGFLRELFEKCRNTGLQTLADSNGSVLFSGYPELLRVTDGVMLDIKAFQPEDHCNVTGTDNEAVLDNAVFLAERGKLAEIRTVVVPELFDAAGTVRAAARLLSPYLGRAPIRYRIITYRPFGVREEYRHYRIPDSRRMEALAGIAEEEGFRDIVIV